MASLHTGLAIFGSFGTTEIVLIVLAVLLLFGGKKIPELARGIGKGLREFKKGARGLHDEIEDAGSAADKPAEPTDSSKERDSPA